MSAASSTPTPPTITPGSAHAWWLAMRHKTLTAAVTPVLVGTACAYASGSFRLGPALGALLGAVFIQIGTNFANDVFDAEKGADTAERLGPLRTVQAGLITARAMRVGMALAFLCAFVCGIYLTAVAGPVIVAIGLASIAAGIAYTGGPYPLGYNGLGDVFVFAFFGFVAVCGTAFAQAGRVPVLAWWTAVPVGALATAILVVNNLRDRHTDTRAGKRTLAVRLGRGGAVAEWFVCLALAYLIPTLIAAGFADGTRSLSLLLPYLSLPLAARPTRSVLHDEGQALNPTLGLTARLLFVHGLLLGLGLTARAA